MKPLLICDCDEVLVHMVRHFRDWLGEAHDMDFALDRHDFFGAVTRRDGGPAPTQAEAWDLLHGFFPGQMDRQTLVPHAAEALAALADQADIVILTNLIEECRTPRIEQLARFGIHHRVQCNTGPKGAPVAKLVAEHGNPVTVFVDDLRSIMPRLPNRRAGPPAAHGVRTRNGPARRPAPEAHARIDDWRQAQAWIAARFAEGLPATA